MSSCQCKINEAFDKLVTSLVLQVIEKQRGYATWNVHLQVCSRQHFESLDCLVGRALYLV